MSNVIQEGLTISQGTALPAACDPGDPQTHSIFFKTTSDAEGAFGMYVAVGSGQWAAVERVIDQADRATVVSASTAQTTLYSATIPADALGVTKTARMHIFGAYTNNTGAGQTLRLRVKFGGVEIYNDVTPSAATATAERGFHILLHLRNTGGAANANILSGVIDIGGTGAATTGSGDLGSDEILSTALVSTPTASSVDTTTDQVLEVTVQLSTATAGGSVRRDMAQLII